MTRPRTKNDHDLERVREEYARVFTLTPALICVAKPDGSFEKVNPAWEKALGFSTAEILELGFAKLIHPDDLRPTMDEVKRQLAGGATANFINRYRCKDGSYRTLEWWATPAVDGTLYAAAADITERLRSVESLRRITSELNSAQAVAHVGSWKWHIKTNRLEWSPEMYRIFGIAESGFSGDLGQVVAHSIHPEDRAAVEASNRSVAERKQPVPLEYRLIRPDGQVRTVWAEAGELLLDRQGNPDLLTGIVMDITERKRIETGLRQSEVRYRQLFESAADATFVISVDDGRILEANSAATALYGHTQVELLAMRNTDLSAEPAETTRNTRAVPPVNDAMVLIPLRMHRKKDGTVFPVEITARFFRQDGRMVHIASIRDISERTRLEAARKRTEAQLNEAQEVARIGSWETDLTTLQVQWSREIFRIFEIDPSRFEPTHPGFLSFVHPEDRARVDAAFLESLDEMRSSNTIEHRIVTPNGDVKTVEERWRVAWDDGGRPTRAMGTCQDITERKKTEAVLANMQKLESLGTLAGGIAHDFNNILTAILGNLALLQSQLQPGGEALEMFQEAQHACGVAKGLSHQLLTFAKGGKPIARVMDLRDVLSEAASFAARGSRSRVVFELGKIPLGASIDKDQVVQIIQNLVLNAVQAMPEGGDIAVRAESVTLGSDECPPLAAGRYVRVRVEDHGIGIPPEHLSRVFDPYFSTKAAGRGLGLAMCHSIMAKHHGSISVASQPKKGTTLTLLFPAMEIPAGTSEERVAKLTPGTGRILVMDDEASVSKVLTRMLARLGYEAVSVIDGKAALAAYEKAILAGRPFAAVIMDLTIPGGMGGKEAMGKLKALDPKARVIASSGYADDPIMSDHAAHGFAGALGKPYRVEDVSEALRRLLA